MSEKLGPDEGIYALQHPDCRACEERERINLGLIAENNALKKKLAGEVPAPAEQQVEADYRSLVRELATMLGPRKPRAGVTQNDQWIAAVGEVLAERDRAQEQQQVEVGGADRLGELLLDEIGSWAMLRSAQPSATPTQQQDQPEPECER